MWDKGELGSLLYAKRHRKVSQIALIFTDTETAAVSPTRTTPGRPLDD